MAPPGVRVVPLAGTNPKARTAWSRSFMSRSPSSPHPREVFGLWLVQVARLWRGELDRRLAPHGLTEARWLTLLHLVQRPGPVMQKELAEMVGVRGPTLVPTLDWLEAEGLIERRTLAQDRRARQVHLTAKAEPTLRRIQSVVDALRADLFGDVRDADMRICLRVFEHMWSRLGGGAPPQPLVRPGRQRAASRDSP